MTEQEKIDKLLEVVRFYANQKNWSMSEFGATITNEDLIQVVEVDFIDRFGGKKARNLLKEIGEINGL